MTVVYVLLERINYKNQCKVLLKTLNVVYDKYPSTRDAISKSLAEIYRNEIYQLTRYFLFILVLCTVVFNFKISVFSKKASSKKYITMTNRKNEMFLVIGTKT